MSGDGLTERDNSLSIKGCLGSGRTEVTYRARRYRRVEWVNREIEFEGSIHMHAIKTGVENENKHCPKRIDEY